VATRLVGPWVGVGALLLLTSLTWVQPSFERLDGATSVRYRWWVVALDDGRRPGEWVALFTDARGIPLDPGQLVFTTSTVATRLRPDSRLPPPVHEAPLDASADAEDEPLLRHAAYASRSDVPRDPWGQPWLLVIDYVELRGGQYRARPELEVRSAGPDGRFEWGADDVVVGPLFPSSFKLRDGIERPVDVPFDTQPLWALLALSLGGLWLSAVGLTAPRARSLGRELGLATCAAVFPGLVVFGCAHDARLDQVLPVADGWLLVSPRVAVALSVVLLLWGAVLVRRLRRPLPTEAP
jgi:hypothetical protein